MKEKLWKWFPLLGAMLVFLLSAVVLTKDTGLANNGDFYRVMKVNRIAFSDDTNQAWQYQSDYVMELEGQNFFDRLTSTWSVAQEELYDSPHFVLVKIAKSLNFLINSATKAPIETFRIEVLSGIYLFLFAFGAWGILSFFQQWRTRLCALFLLLFVFCDMGYLLYFHSFYGEALQFVCMMILIGALLHLTKKPSVGWFLVLLISVYFLAGAKLANIPYALCILLAGMLLVRKRKWLFLPALVTGILIVMLLGSIPDWMNHDTTYQSVFFGILKESPPPEKDVAELGLPAKYAVLQNTHAYFEEYPIDITSKEFQTQFFDRIGKIDVVGFYLKHPVRFIKKLSRAISYSGSIRPPSLANSGSERMGMTNRYSLWSHLRLRSKLLYTPWAIWLLLIGMGISVVWWLIVCIRKKQLQPLLIPYVLLFVGLCANLILPVAGNGEADLAKHLFFMIHLVDIAVAAGVTILIFQAPKWRWKALLPVGAAGLLCLICNLSSYGETVSFGGYKWTVLKETDTSTTLVCNEIVDILPFDKEGEFGQNVWVNSTLRTYLNTEFLSEEVYETLLPMTYQVCLSSSFRDKAEEGWYSMIWTHEPNTVASLWQDAWRMKVTDKVTLLTLPQYEAGGFQRALGENYWLADPYGSNDSMVRYADAFGQVLHRDANQPTGVRPVITVKNKFLK